MSFQDDIARIVSDVGSAQAGNVKISSMMKEKQLEVHPDKTGFIVMGTEKYKQQIFAEIQNSPIMFGNIETKLKVADKYLGDIRVSQNFPGGT